MPWYEYKGEKVEAQTPEAAKALIRNRLEGGEVDPTEGMSGMDKFLAGAGSGAMNVLRQTGNILGVVDDEAIAEQRRIDAPLMESGAGQAGRLVGDVAATLPLGLGAGAAARGVLGAGSRVIPAAAEAATEGAILAGPGERGAGAMMGGGLGGAMGLAGRQLTKMGRPRGTPASAALEREGVNLTVGQRSPGFLRAAEESVVGRQLPMVKRARQQAIDDTVRVMMRRAAPTDEAASAIRMGAEDLTADLDKLYNSFEPLYAQVKGYPAKFVTRNGQRLDAALVSTADNFPADDMVRQRVSRFIQNELSGLKNRAGKQLETDDLLELRSRIRARVRDIQRRNGDPYELAAYDAVERQLSDAIEGSLPPEAIQVLRNADGSYAKYKTVEDIMASRKSRDMTAGAIQRGIDKAEARISGSGAAARGSDVTGFGDIAEAAVQHLPEKTGMTGATLALPLASAALGAATGGLAGAGVGGTVLPAGLAALGVVAGRGRARAGADAARRALAQTMERIGRSGPIARAGAVGYASQEDY